MIVLAGRACNDVEKERRRKNMITLSRHEFISPSIKICLSGESKIGFAAPTHARSHHHPPHHPPLLLLGNSKEAQRNTDSCAGTISTLLRTRMMSPHFVGLLFGRNLILFRKIDCNRELFTGWDIAMMFPRRVGSTPNNQDGNLRGLQRSVCPVFCTDDARSC